MRFINSYPQKMAAFVGKALIRVGPKPLVKTAIPSSLL